MEKEESSNNLAVSTKGKRLSCNLRVKQNRVVLDRMLKKKGFSVNLQTEPGTQKFNGCAKLRQGMELYSSVYSGCT